MSDTPSIPQELFTRWLRIYDATRVQKHTPKQFAKLSGPFIHLYKKASAQDQGAYHAMVASFWRSSAMID